RTTRKTATPNNRSRPVKNTPGAVPTMPRAATTSNKDAAQSMATFPYTSDGRSTARSLRDSRLNLPSTKSVPPDVAAASTTSEIRHNTDSDIAKNASTNGTSERKTASKAKVSIFLIRNESTGVHKWGLPLRATRIAENPASPKASCEKVNKALPMSMAFFRSPNEKEISHGRVSWQT